MAPSLYSVFCGKSCGPSEVFDHSRHRDSPGHCGLPHQHSLSSQSPLGLSSHNCPHPSLLYRSKCRTHPFCVNLTSQNYCPILQVQCERDWQSICWHQLECSFIFFHQPISRVPYPKAILLYRHNFSSLPHHSLSAPLLTSSLCSQFTPPSASHSLIQAFPLLTKNWIALLKWMALFSTNLYTCYKKEKV